MDQLNVLVEQYKDVYESVYRLDLGEESFIFRPLTRKEYHKLNSLRFPDAFSTDEVICQIATIYPENYDFSEDGRAGVAGQLAKMILSHSGYLHPHEQLDMLEYYRGQMMSFESQAEACIALVFQGTTEEEMKEWTQEKMFRMLAKAEWVMKNIWSLPFEFAPKKEEDEETEEEVQQPTMREIGKEIRESGADPMFALQHHIVKNPADQPVPFPFIGGTQLLKNEEMLAHARKHVSRLPD